MKPAHIPPPISYVSIAKKIKLSPFIFTLFILLLPLIAYVYKEDLIIQLVDQFGGIIANQPETLAQSEKKKRLPFVINKLNDGNSCNLFSGKWVRDNITRPLYQEADCPYMMPQMDCLRKGRLEKEYQFWRWQPFECDLPSFNATMMLEALRGKRMLFVGDSLNRGQFTSMVCLLQSVIPKHAKSYTAKGSLRIFTAMDYNATIEFYWAPLLLESNKDHPTNHRISDQIVRNGSINTHGDHWKGRDIIIFDTYIWWTKRDTIKILEGSFQDEEKKVVKVSIEDGYSLAINSTLAWVKKNMDLSKTRVFFTSMSPTHEKSEDWGAKPGGNCYNETKIIEDLVYWDSNGREIIMRVITDILRKLHDEVPVTFLNITQLSLYRKDAHTAIYKKHWNGFNPKQPTNPVRNADCIHWCLPGLQDIWNELLFAKLFFE